MDGRSETRDKGAVEVEERADMRTSRTCGDRRNRIGQLHRARLAPTAHTSRGDSMAIRVAHIGTGNVGRLALATIALTQFINRPRGAMKTAIYLRQSLDRDQTKLAIARQRDDLLKLCANRGWDDPVEYCDNNISANKGRRAAYQEMLDDIRNGIVNRVVVWDLDRLHRQPIELEAFFVLADDHRVELASVGGDVDLATPSGRMFARMKGTVAKYETEHKAARQKTANLQRAKSGKSYAPRAFGPGGVTAHQTCG